MTPPTQIDAVRPMKLDDLDPPPLVPPFLGEGSPGKTMISYGETMKPVSRGIYAGFPGLSPPPGAFRSLPGAGNFSLRGKNPPSSAESGGIAPKVSPCLLNSQGFPLPLPPRLSILPSRGVGRHVVASAPPSSDPVTPASGVQEDCPLCPPPAGVGTTPGCAIPMVVCARKTRGVRGSPSPPSRHPGGLVAPLWLPHPRLAILSPLRGSGWMGIAPKTGDTPVPPCPRFPVPWLPGGTGLRWGGEMYVRTRAG